jgi:hypothetical protein
MHGIAQQRQNKDASKVFGRDCHDWEEEENKEKNSGALDIENGSSASNLGSSIAILVDSGTDIGGASSVMFGNSPGAVWGDASIVSGLSSTSSGSVKC